jgi:elongator complex protein 3
MKSLEVKPTQLAKEVVRRAVKASVSSLEELRKVEREVVREERSSFPRGVELLAAYREMVGSGLIEAQPDLEELLRVNRVRTLSGVAVVAVLTRPYDCPGECVYCPTEEGIPTSYLSNEPAVMRALQCQYDPYKQVEMRLKTLELTGHVTDKVEVIVLGGTFSALPFEYQSWFIKELYDALNQQKSADLIKAQKLNEKAAHRLVGLTIETRPDMIDKSCILRFRELGVTRVELGVQTVDVRVLEKVKRGHKLEEVIRATKLLKDTGFKVGYHIMPNLPGVSLKDDLSNFLKLFKNSNFRPDQLKIYPCVVVKGSQLYEWWKRGQYQPYQTDELIDLLARMKREVPIYVRITRLFRDIPADRIEDGCQSSNLRQIVSKEMARRGWDCRCIRCREVREQAHLMSKDKVKLYRFDYEASNGQEVFLTFEDTSRKRLYSFLRLRLPSLKQQGKTFKVLKDSALVRELHTYGEQVPLGERMNAAQHFGLGKALLTEAERIAEREWGVKKLAVIAAVGVRDYYRRLGYRLEETYMVKSFPSYA